MQQWGYVVVPSQGGQVQTPGGVINVGQMLNAVGQKGGELVTVVPAGGGVLEWIFKFAVAAPAQLF